MVTLGLWMRAIRARMINFWAFNAAIRARMVALRLQLALLDPHEQVVFGELRARLSSDQLVVLRAERELVDLARHRREPRVGVVLAHVRPEGFALLVDVVVDVDASRHELVGSSG